MIVLLLRNDNEKDGSAMKCLNPKCENDVQGSRSTRKFCGDACRQAYFRHQHQQDQAQGQTFTEMLSELTDLRAKVYNQAQTIEELEQEVTRLKSRLDVERRYLEDTAPRTFLAWLKKQPSSPVAQKLLADQLVPARGSRALYEAHVKRLHCTEDERQDFTRLWKLMLLSRP